jgi:hypothetical protein
LRLAEHLARVLDEEREQLELLRPERHGLAVAPHLLGPEVDLDAAEGDHIAVARSRGEPQHGPDAREQTLRLDRLGEVLVGLGVEATELVLLRVESRQHHDRYVVRQAAQLAAHVETRDVRQSNVEQHKVRPAIPHGREGLAARADRLHSERLAFQQRDEVRAQTGLVLDDENPHDAPPLPARVSTRVATNQGGSSRNARARRAPAAGRAPSGQAVSACPLFLSGGAAEAPGSRAAEGGRAATRAERAPLTLEGRPRRMRGPRPARTRRRYGNLHAETLGGPR